MIDENVEKDFSMTLKFNFREDKQDILNMLNADDAYCRLNNIYNLCRTQLKHGDEELSNHIENLLERIKEIAYIDF